MKLLIFIVGNTCSGKTTLQEVLSTRLGASRFVTNTTRDMRNGEVNGVDYFFRSLNDFNSCSNVIESDEYRGNVYYIDNKTFEDNLLSSSDVATLVITENGAKEIQDYLDANKQLGIFYMNILVNTSKDLCVKRMVERGMSDNSINLSIDEFLDLDDLMLDYDFVYGGNHDLTRLEYFIKKHM